jgi:hypothetical protein
MKHRRTVAQHAAPRSTGHRTRSSDAQKAHKAALCAVWGPGPGAWCWAPAAAVPINRITASSCGGAMAGRSCSACSLQLAARSGGAGCCVLPLACCSHGPCMDAACGGRLPAELITRATCNCRLHLLQLQQLLFSEELRVHAVADCPLLNEVTARPTAASA